MADTGEKAKTSSSTDECEDVDKILAVVVKRRKTFPTKICEINGLIFEHELNRLAKAEIITEDMENIRGLRQIVQELRSSEFLNLSFDDLHDAEKKLQRCHKRIKDINCYLKKRKRTCTDVA